MEEPNASRDRIAIAAASLALVACGRDEKTGVVHPPAQQQLAQDNTVVAPQSGSTPRICANGAVNG